MNFTPDTSPIPGKKVAKHEPKSKKQEEISGLDLKTSKQVRDWSYVWLENFYNEGGGPDSDFSARLDFTERVEALIAQLVGETDSHTKGLLAFRYREGVNIFLNTLIDFIEEKSADTENRTKLQAFTSGLHEAIFSFSPNLSNHIGLENLLITTAKATRVPEAQGWFGQNMVGELTYELNWAHEESIERILDKIRKLDLPEQLDVIHQLITVAADAIAQGEPGYEAHDRIIGILETVNQESQYPIIRYATENALITIRQEEEDPSLSVITFRGNVAGARLPEQLSGDLTEQSDLLKRQIRITNSPTGSYKILPISSDAVGLFDHSNTPRQFGTVDFSSLPNPAKLNGLEVERLKEGAEAKLDRYQFDELFARVTNLLLRQEKEKRATTSQVVVEKWAEISDQFSREEWEKIFSVILRRQELEDMNIRKISELRERTENENRVASSRFIELVIAEGKNILADLPSVPSILQEDYNNLIKYNQEGNEERTFTSAEGFAGFFRILQNYSTGDRQGLSEEKFQKGLELARELKSLHQFHVDNWRACTDAEGQIQSVENNREAEAELMEFITVKDQIAEKQEQLQADILKFLQKIDQDLATKLIAVEVKPFKQIETDPNLNPFRGEDTEQLALLLQYFYNPNIQKMLGESIEIDLREISLRSQIHLIRFLAKANSQIWGRFLQCQQEAYFFRREFLNSFLIAAEDSSTGIHILDISELLWKQPDQWAKVFRTYNEYIEIVSGIAKKVGSDLQKEFPDLFIGENMIVQSLLIRVKDFMLELEIALKSNLGDTEALIEKFTQELKKETPKEQVVRAQFKTVASLLDREDTDLKTFEQNQELVLGSLVKGTVRSLFFRTLGRMGRLSPIPEIHWRVDRSNEEYNRRLGINLVEFLQQRAESSQRKQILLEIGPGSGVAKAERVNLGLSEHYQDVALSDKIYYPLSGVVGKLIDYSHLEQAIGKELGQSDQKIELSQEERLQLADFIYKSLIIAKGQTSGDTFDYDEQNQASLVEDINNLKNIISSQLSERLKLTSEVPDRISAHRDGRVVYPNKIKTNSWSPQLQAAKKLLENNPTQFMRSDWDHVDYYSLIEAFPANVMVGDLSQIAKLKDDQVDVELGVRSTVYKRGEEYGEFLQQLIEKLSRRGVAIDDSIRDNDGWYYRIAEILEAKEKSGSDTEILVILGPGFPGEDKRQDRVPLSMIITKQGSSLELIRKNLLPGYEIVKLEDLASNQDYLGSLDDTGLTKEKVTRQTAMVS